MSYNRAHSILASLRQSLREVNDFSRALSLITKQIGEYFYADVVRIFLLHKETLNFDRWERNNQFTQGIVTWPVSVQDKEITLGDFTVKPPLMISDLERARSTPSLITLLRKSSIHSYALIPIVDRDRYIGAIEISHVKKFHRWNRDDIFILEEMAGILSLASNSLFKVQQEGKKFSLNVSGNGISITPQSPEETSERLARFGNLIFLRTDRQFQIVEVHGDIELLLGIKPEVILSNNRVWEQMVESSDLRRLRRAIFKARSVPQEINEEVRFKVQTKFGPRVLQLHGIPILENAKIVGWEGFGIDVTEKRHRETEMLQQNRRIEALYEVARATQLHFDPAMVMLKGLRALLRATGSSSGMGCTYDAQTDKIELIAIEGLSQQFVDDVERRINGSTLIRKVINERQGMLIKNVQEDPRALLDIVRKEGVKSTIVVPLQVDDQILGVVVLYSKEANRFTSADYDLVQAATTQIAAASRQAESYASERRHADSLATLYRMSHELSKYVNASEVAERAFPLIQKELPCKRMWLGVLSEQGSHIAGQAGFGPGVRKKLINIQIELYLRHDHLDQAIRSKQAVIVEPGAEMECSGLNSIMRRLNAGLLIIIPLVSLSQVVGVLVIEPTLSSVQFAKRKISLLTSMANEIATVLLARRYESKMAEADKMRMANMLASGVAHNFNNLLQAVMGQASLIEMQLAKDSPLSKSARMIIEASGKGASLISQLLNFSVQDVQKRINFSPMKMLKESEELYHSVIGKEISLSFKMDENISEIHADYGQIQQVLSNLLINAKEAISGKSNGHITVTLSEVKLRSGEVDPELAPGTYVRIDVTDNGIGMDAERQARCFEPFYSSKNVDFRTGIGFSGSGLGLSSAYSILKQHDGLIAVRSTLGEGSTFSIFLPVVVKSKFSAEVELQVADQSKAEVLLFDVGETLQKTIRPILSSSGLSSLHMTNQQEVKDLLNVPANKVCCLLVDVDNSGYEIIGFVRNIQKDFPAVLIIIASSDARRWSRILSNSERIYVVAKPLGVWGIHALARKITEHKKNAGLSLQVETLISEDDRTETKELASISDHSENIANLSEKSDSI